MLYVSIFLAVLVEMWMRAQGVTSSWVPVLPSPETPDPDQSKAFVVSPFRICILLHHIFYNNLPPLPLPPSSSVTMFAARRATRSVIPTLRAFQVSDIANQSNLNGH